MQPRFSSVEDLLHAFEGANDQPRGYRAPAQVRAEQTTMAIAV